MSHYSDAKLDATFGQALIEKELIPSETFHQVLQRSKATGNSPIDVLAGGLGFDEHDLYVILSEQIKLPYLELKNSSIDPGLLEKVPVKIAWHYCFMPVKYEKGNLTIAVEYPLNTKTLDEIQIQLGCELAQVLSRRVDILESLRAYYGFAADTVEKIFAQDNTGEIQMMEQDGSVEEIDQTSEDASVVNLVNEIIYEACKKNATDIHFEPYRGVFRLRYRVDGILQDANLSKKARHLILPVLSRIKIMANLDIVEHRLPQDGRALVKVKGQNLDLRISSIPTPHGESIVIRVLPTQMSFSLKKLGLTDSNVDIFENIIKNTHGIILLTGPTGCGKTTTLYACLSHINSREKKIITIEDPIEYEITGITQIQVMPKVGFSFAAGLRSVLRHDPDVMMVGEIRDYETAEIAIRSALTGHLVFSTLHTNDAVSGITRLLDIGVEPFLVASSVEAIIAQRLIRIICTKCRVIDENASSAIKQQIAKDLDLSSLDEVVIYRGKGCDACGRSGYAGRTAIHEILTFSESIKELVLQKAATAEIEALTIQEGMQSLRQDGWLKVMAGITTPAEIINVVNMKQQTTVKETKKKTEPVKEATPAEVKSVSVPEFTDNISGRISTRMDTDFQVLFISLTAKKGLSETTAFAENLSAGGVYLKTRKKLSNGESLQLKFKIPGVSNRLMRCKAKVMRIENQDDSGIRGVGVIFEDLSTDDRALIDEYVYRLRNTQGGIHA